MHIGIIANMCADGVVVVVDVDVVVIVAAATAAAAVLLMVVVVSPDGYVMLFGVCAKWSAGYVVCKSNVCTAI